MQCFLDDSKTMASPDFNQKQFTLADLLLMIGQIFLDIGEGVDNMNEAQEEKILKAVQDAASGSKNLREFPDNLQNAFDVQRIPINKPITEIDALIEYASLLAQVQKEEVDWDQAGGGFLSGKPIQ